MAIAASGTSADTTSATADVRAAAKAFAASEIEPIAARQDELAASPLDVYARFWEAGLAGSIVDIDRPGYLADLCVVADELAYACAGIGTLLILPNFFNRIVARHLAEPARSEFLERIGREPVLTAFAASEARAGSDFSQLETEAVRVDGGYRLTGSKAYSSNLRHADYIIVVAKTTSPGPGPSGSLTWFLVPAGAPGATVGPRWRTFGMRAMDLSPFELRDVFVPDGYRLGAEGGGVGLLSESLGQSRTGIGAIAVGVARRARDEVMAYGASRRLYGGKLHKLQDYRFRIAQLTVDVAAAESLVQRSAAVYDSGRPHTLEASIAKLYAGQMAMRVTVEASGMLGSAGYTGQTVVEKLVRDARHTGIVEGTDPTHKE
ncbi:MAG: acyl-CoA dehydrogenase family protein, partial [Candidatus Limnocylindrales bacterium]